MNCTPPPLIYSGDASIYVLKAGVKLLEAGRADFLYLSTTDYMQHKFAPEEPEAIEFYAAIDAELGRLLELGAVIGVTADHGMNAKRKPDGSPNVIYLESGLVEAFDAGFRVILPITDPYVAHHGALGSYAVVHVPEGIDPDKVAKWIGELPGVTEVYDRPTAARKLELPRRSSWRTGRRLRPRLRPPRRRQDDGRLCPPPPPHSLDPGAPPRPRYRRDPRRCHRSRPGTGRVTAAGAAIGA